MTFRIEYPTGCMELEMDEFFPCIQKKARIVFPLINDNCDRERWYFLCNYLEDRAFDFAVQENKTMYRRALMNIRWLEKGGEIR